MVIMMMKCIFFGDKVTVLLLGPCQVGGGMVSSGQYITMSGQQAVTIPVVGSVQGHIPSIGHVVQVRW